MAKSSTKNTVTMTVLGCGTSTGVPLMHCKCKVCCSKNPKNKRLRASVWVQSRDKSILIDTSTDLRQQAMTYKIPRVDSVLYTHPHADHVHGIDELRSFNFVQKSSISVYGNAWTCQELKKKFEYIFDPRFPAEGGGIPLLQLNQFDPTAARLNVSGVSVVPLILQHGTQECIGYRIDAVAYVTDCSYIPTTTLDRMKGLSVLVLDCVRLDQHRTHLNFDQALEIVDQLKPKKTYLTHMGHDFDYASFGKGKAHQLPKGVELAYDGLKIRA